MRRMKGEEVEAVEQGEGVVEEQERHVLGRHRIYSIHPFNTPAS